jgi:hypothetical protein
VVFSGATSSLFRRRQHREDAIAIGRHELEVRSRECITKSRNDLFQIRLGGTVLDLPSLTTRGKATSHLSSRDWVSSMGDTLCCACALQADGREWEKPGRGKAQDNGAVHDDLHFQSVDDACFPPSLAGRIGGNEPDRAGRRKKRAWDPC